MENTPITKIAPQTGAVIRRAFLENMDREYGLIRTGYEDHFNHSGETIQKCLDANSDEALYDTLWEAGARREGSEYVLEGIRDKLLCTGKYGPLHPYIDEWLEEDVNKEAMLEAIEERDNSNPYREMLSRSRIRARVTLYTNYDSLPHNYDMDNTYYYDGYIKDIVDVLCLNPAKVKQAFNQKGINTTGRWPDKKKRNGREAVRYEALGEELLNQCCYGLLTFMGLMPLADLYEHNFAEYKTIVVPKGNNCGMFGHWNGGGSLMEMELLRDLYIPAAFPKKTEYDRCELCVDEPRCGNGTASMKCTGLSLRYGEEKSNLFTNRNKQ